MNISSPMGSGSGAFVIHQSLAKAIPNYQINTFNPNWTLFPPALPHLFRSQQADIIHTTSDFGYFFKQKNIPLIITFHSFVLDLATQKYSSFSQKIFYRTGLRYFTKKTLTHSDAVTSVSRFTADLIKKELKHDEKIKIIYNGVDTEKFKPAKPNANNKIKILFSGNITKRKGAHWLPRIASLLNKGITIYYTSGLRTKNKLPRKQNLVNVGRIPFTEMASLYQDVDMLLFPTVREGFGLAAAEAMACGLPVVATNCSSLPELVIDGKGGYLCELGNVDQFAKRINELAESPSLRREMGQFNRTRVEKKFTLQQMIQGYLELFTEVLDSKT